MKTQHARNFSDMEHPSEVSRTGAFAEYILTDDGSMPGLALGATVIIEDTRDGKPFWMAGTVIGIKSISPFIADRDILLYNRTGERADAVLNQIQGPHTEQRLIINVRLDTELELQDGEYIHSPVQRPASSQSRMMIPVIEDQNDGKPTMADILGLKQKGIPIGFVGAGNSPREENGSLLPYFIDIQNLDNKHQFIVGESGSGKTVLLKKMALELRKLNFDNKKPRVIMTDVQGDLLQLMMPEIVGSINRKGWQKQLPVNGQKELESMGPFQLILPVSTKADERRTAAIKTVIEAYGHKVTEIGLRMQDIESVDEIEYLLRLSSEQAPMLIEDVMDDLREKNRNASIENIVGGLQLIRNQESEDKRNRQSPSGTTYYTSTVDAAMRGCRFLKDIFDHHENSLLSEKNPLDCLKFEGTSIFFLEHLDSEERLMWGMQLVKWLYKNKRESGEFFVFIDEAHQLIPARPPAAGSKGTFPRLRDNFERLAREGRKFGINLILGTQSPRDLNEIVPNQCPTKIVMKIDRSNAKYAYIDDSEARIASKFSQGQMWLKSPFNGTSEWLRIHSPAPEVPHESMTNFWPTLENEAKKMVGN